MILHVQIQDMETGIEEIELKSTRREMSRLSFPPLTFESYETDESCANAISRR